MKLAGRLLLRALLLALPSVVTADTATYSDASLQGTYDCQITVFAWPQSRGDPLMPNSNGTSETLLDGSGKISDGEMKLHSVRDPNEGPPCRYHLKNGTYVVKSDGSGRVDGEWKSWEGGGSGWKCFDRGLPPNGPQVGVVKPGPVFMESMLATQQGARVYNVLYDQTGITISVCDRK